MLTGKIYVIREEYPHLKSKNKHIFTFAWNLQNMRFCKISVLGLILSKTLAKNSFSLCQVKVTNPNNHEFN